MAFFQLVLKARNLEKARLEYEDEKLRSIKISKGAKARYTLKQRIRRMKLRCKRRVKGIWNKIISCPEDSWFHKKAVALRTDGTFDNYILKSILGFLGGIFLTYIFFFFFVFQLNFKLSSATFLCSIIGVILTLGLAFSYRVRCVVFLLLPQFFSKRGRQALMAYAFILAVTGPAKNTLHNTGVLSESLACGQEQLKEAVKTIVDLAKQPFYALRDAISQIIKTVKTVVKKIKQTLIAIKRLVLSILRVITSVFQWLGSIVNMCNKKLGTPFDRCQRVFEGAVADCKAKLGPFFGVVCNLTYIVSALCYIVKPLDFICMLVSYIADTVVGVVRNKIQKFAMHMKAMFYVKVKFSHSFHFETNQSKTIGEVSTGIITEIRSKTDNFLALFDWMSFLTSFFIFFLLLRVIHYRHKWLTNERFENRYITDDLRTIDLIRTRQEKETVLPLNPRERNRYVSLSSVTLIKPEKIKLTKSAIFLGITTIKLLTYMMVDYSLYWILSTIRYHGRIQGKVERPSVVTMQVSGDGYLAELYRSIVKAFSPHEKETEIDTVPCLPDPIPPDFDRYIQIVTLIVFCWLMTITEPYGLRLRHIVMCQYHPERAKQRAAWLYNHIIRSRGSFLKFARRQLRRKFGMDDKTEKVTLRERLTAMCPWLNILFPLKQTMCVLCGSVERNEDNPHIKCSTPGCVGIFCPQCFADLQNLCTICKTPMEYGDLSDMSEEMDSSDDQIAAKRKPEPVKKEVKEIKETKEKEEPKVEKKKEIKEKDEPVTKVEEPEKKEKIEKVEKDKAEQTEETAAKDFDATSESTYSYSYQDESPTEEIEVDTKRKPFKDIEAQKVCDDVTIQIFNDPLVIETSSASESPPCFVVRAHRRIRARTKKKSRGRDSDSTSIADTESWPTEEVDEEEVLHIEVDNDSEELLLKDRKEKAKLGRISRIVGAVSRIPWLGKTDSNKCTGRGLQTRRPSLMNKIVSMLQGKQSVPIQTYRRTRRIKKHSSSSSLSLDEEEKALIEVQDRATSTERLARGKIRREMIEDDSDDSSYSIDSGSDDFMSKNVDLRYPSEKKFPVKKIPRYLESTSKDTSYFEVDETEDSQIRHGCVREVEDINALSDVRTSDSRRMDNWNIMDDDSHPVSCSCTTEITYDTSADKTVRSREMTTISERSDDLTKTSRDSEVEDTSAVSQTDTEYTEQAESTETDLKDEEVTSEIPTKIEKLDESSDYEDSTKLEDTREETSTEVAESPPEKSKRRSLIAEEFKKLIPEKDESRKLVPLESESEEITPQKETIKKRGPEKAKLQKIVDEKEKPKKSVPEKEKPKRLKSKKEKPKTEGAIHLKPEKEKSKHKESKKEKPKHIETKKEKPKSLLPKKEETKDLDPEKEKPKTLLPKKEEAIHLEPEKEKPKTSEFEKTSQKVSLESDQRKLHDPLAGLELYGVSSKSTRRAKVTRERIIEEDKTPDGKKGDQIEDGKKEDKIKDGKKEDKIKDSKKEDKIKDGKKEDKIKDGKKEDKIKDGKKEDKIKDDKKKDKKEDPVSTIDTKQDTKKKSAEIEEKTEEELEVETQKPQTKIDKGTDLRDKSRGTQTKIPKPKDEKKPKSVKHADVPEKLSKHKDEDDKSQSAKLLTTRKKSDRHKQKRKKKSRKDDNRIDLERSPRRRKRSVSERSTLTDDDKLRRMKKREKRSHHRETSSQTPTESPRKKRQWPSDEVKHIEKYPKEKSVGSPGRYVPGFRPIISPESPEIVDHRRRERDTGGFSHRYDTTFADRPCGTYDQIRRIPCREIPQCSEYNYPRQRQPASYRERYPGQFPVLKKYLPLYQNPELIEELKRHDRMKLIQEREARRRRLSDFGRTENFSLSSRAGRSDRTSVACNPPKSISPRLIENRRLPYQETEAYRNVMCEFQKAVHRRSDETRGNVPLIYLSRKADKTMEVKQLYPPDNRCQRQPSATMRITKKIANAFNPFSGKRDSTKIEKQNFDPAKAREVYCKKSIDRETLSKTYSDCDCSNNAHRLDVSSSMDETTDNNESAR